MKDAYALLEITGSAGLEEIEEAYQRKKKLANPERYSEGSRERNEAFAKNRALDEAYSLVTAAFMAPRPITLRRRSPSAEPPWGEFVVLLALYPLFAALIQHYFPALLFDLVPRETRAALWPLVLFVVLSSYLIPSILRFFSFRRPLRGLWVRLVSFPATLLFCDILTSSLLHFSLFSHEKSFAYVPTFYLVGLGPLFILLLGHVQILNFPPPEVEEERTPRWRLSALTGVLGVSISLSLALCLLQNGKTPPLPSSSSEGEGVMELASQEEPWQVLELSDAGVLELPRDWYVEDSNGKLHVTRNGSVVQYVREVLTARPYGANRENGPDFAFEILSYWWTHENGALLSSPADTPEKTLSHQLESLKRDYPDTVVVRQGNKEEYGGRRVSLLTAETRSIPSHVVRFTNLAFRHEKKLYFLAVSYPAEEESFWEFLIARILRRWQPLP